MMDATSMFLTGFHPWENTLLPDRSGPAEIQPRSRADVNYYFTLCERYELVSSQLDFVDEEYPFHLDIEVVGILLCYHLTVEVSSFCHGT
jgi:hypothetical protein